jgi:hypothetical protein
VEGKVFGHREVDRMTVMARSERVYKDKKRRVELRYISRRLSFALSMLVSKQPAR